MDCVHLCAQQNLGSIAVLPLNIPPLHTVLGVILTKYLPRKKVCLNCLLQQEWVVHESCDCRAKISPRLDDKTVAFGGIMFLKLRFQLVAFKFNAIFCFSWQEKQPLKKNNIKQNKGPL